MKVEIFAKMPGIRRSISSERGAWVPRRDSSSSPTTCHSCVISWLLQPFLYSAFAPPIAKKEDKIPV